jgi:hypothetical protein
LKTRLAVLAVASLASVALCASTASATVSVSSFGMSLSSTQAGGSADVAVDTKFAASSGDTVKDETMRLAPGLLVNPTAASVCAPSAFQAGTCAPSSQVGDGTLTANEIVIGKAQFPVDIYLLAPQGSEFARLGLIARFGGAPAAEILATVHFRSSPDIGLDVQLAGLPNQLTGIPSQTTELSLRLFGTVNGTGFTRLPTSCSPAQSQVTTDSYQVPTSSGPGVTSFTPANCGMLSYGPSVGLSANVDPSDDGVAFRASVAQASSDAPTSSFSFVLPAGLAARRSALSPACAPGCPSVGTATLRTPLLPSPITGQLVAAPNATLYVLLPPPLGLTLPGSVSGSTNGPQLTFSGLPDIPLSGMEVDLNGGAGSILMVGTGLCSGPQTVGGQLVADSGATVPVNAGLGVGGCRNFGSATPRSAASYGSLSGFASGHPKLHFQASNVTSMSIGLPRGVSFSLRKRGGLSLSGAKLKQLKISHGRLVITLRSSAVRVGVTITAPLLRESAGFQGKVKGHRIKSSVVGLKLTGIAGQTSLSLKLKVT